MAQDKNQLLAALPEGEYQRLLPRLETVRVSIKELLYEANQPIEYVYFPRSLVASMVTIMEDGTEVEFATVGNEGMLGVPAFLGARTFPNRSFCQVPGDAVRMTVDALREVTSTNGTLRDLLQKYTVGLFSQIAQHASCNRVHSVDQRCAKWLLMTLDRAGKVTFPLTQEFLGQMLGVRRATVNEVVGKFRKAGYITYTRGIVTVLDRRALESVTCECYWDIIKGFAEVTGGIVPNRNP